MQEPTKDEIEEMLALAHVAKTLRLLLDYLSVSYAFFLYGLSVVGSALVSASILTRAGLLATSSVAVGAFTGILLATLLYSRVKPLLLPEPAPGFGKRVALSFILPFTTLPIVFGAVDPDYAPVSWFPALGAALILSYKTTRIQILRYHLYAGLAILALSPPIVLLMDNILAMGATALVYLAAGTISLAQGLKQVHQD